MKTKWAFLISNWGRSAYYALEAQEKGGLLNASIDLVGYENVQSKAVEKARELGIPTVDVSKKEKETKNDCQKRICDELLSREIDFVFLLGYNHIIQGYMLGAFENRIVNIHPSILPSFKGLDAIGQAIKYGSRLSGITTHIIDSKLDEGVILFQEPIPILEGDTFETLYPRFLETGKGLVIKTINKMSHNYRIC